MTDDTPPVLYISADTSDLTTRYKATPRMHMAAKAWYPEETVDALVEALGSIARNTCCDGCQEAARVARAALAALPAPDEGEQDEGE